MAERLRERERKKESETKNKVAEAIVESRAERRAYAEGVKIVEEGRCRENPRREQASKAMSRLSDVQIDGQEKKERGLGYGTGWGEI